MADEKHKFSGFLKGLLSEENGKASSARVHMVFWSMITAVVLGFIMKHVMQMKDPNLVGVWLSNLPMLLLSLMGLMNSGYAINQGSNAVGKLMEVMQRIKAGKPADSDPPADPAAPAPPAGT